MALFSKGAGPQVKRGNQQQNDAQNLQRRLADIPALGNLHHAGAKNNAAEQDIPQPVGGNAQGEDTGNGRPAQPQTRVEPIAHTNAAYPGAERQIKGVADKRHQHHLAFSQLVAAVGAPQQIVAAIDQVAGDNQPDGAEQRRTVVIANHFPHVLPVNFLGVDHQQNDDGDKKEHRQDFFRHPPARVRFRHQDFTS